MNIFIRDITHSDVSEVSLIAQKLCIPKNEYHLSEKDVTHPNKKFILACADNNIIIGYAGIRHVDNEAELLTIAVDNAHQKQGIGTKLMKSLINYCQKQKIRKITLEVRTSNQAAQKLYLKTGFCILRTRKNYYNNPTENAVLMEMGI